MRACWCSPTSRTCPRPLHPLKWLLAWVWTTPTTGSGEQAVAVNGVHGHDGYHQHHQQ
jgi:hypothetical protein